MLDRNLILSDAINESTVRDLIKSIRDINVEDDLREQVYQDYPRVPIELVINSPGGYVDDGLALIGAIQLSQTPVHTIALGLAASMALFVFVSGHRRYVHSMATLMYHDITAQHYATLEQNRRHQQESERRAAMLDQYLLSRTRIKQGQLNKVKSEVRDWYIDAKTALQLGIADEVLCVVEGDSQQQSCTPS